MNPALSDISDFIDALLDIKNVADWPNALNGLQLANRGRVSKIAAAVDAGEPTVREAAAEGIDLLLVHHGLFWGSGVRTIDATLARRLKLLFDADIALAAYHLPLDAHPELGNNAQLAKALGASEELEPFAPVHGQPIGFIAGLPGDGLAPTELVGRVRELTTHGQSANRTPLLLAADPQTGPARISRLAIVSGAGADYLTEAAAAGADALLTGEPEERSMALARELGIHLIAAGHHATETFGVRRLGEHLAERFGVRHVFLDVPNPV